MFKSWIVTKPDDYFIIFQIFNVIWVSGIVRVVSDENEFCLDAWEDSFKELADKVSLDVDHVTVFELRREYVFDMIVVDVVRVEDKITTADKRQSAGVVDGKVGPEVATLE